jgi:F420-non-reducing hydrogenase iron-sulfur subunit
MILKAFERGADGVMVVGCLEGDCHYLSGNIRAKARVARVKALLDQIGIGGERVAMFNVSAGEGTKFARFATEMVEKVRALGPTKINLARGAKNRSESCPIA